MDTFEAQRQWDGPLWHEVGKSQGKPKFSLLFKELFILKADLFVP